MSTAVPSDVAPGPVLPERLRGLPLGPAEGWLTVAFTILMAATVAWSLDDAAWVLGKKEWGDFLPWAATFAVLTGLATAKLGWPRWFAHLGGAVVAALVLPVLVGSILVGPGGNPVTMFQATSEAAYYAWVDLAVLQRPSTIQSGHYLLAIGVIVWSVGQFAGYAVFGHRRPLDAVIVVGIVLLANMALTFNSQLQLLVLFSIAALGLLARTHAWEEETTWVRRRMGDAGAVRGLYLKGGAAFIALAVFGSLVLTASASSAPLADAWRGFDRTLVSWSQSLQGYLPFGGSPRAVGFGFGNQAQITGFWNEDRRQAVTIRLLDPSDRQPYYWRAVAFDRYLLNSWSWTDPQPIGRAAGEPVLGELADAPTDAIARRDIQFEVTVDGPIGDFVLSPMDPTAVSEPTTLQVVGDDGWFSALDVDPPVYTVSASVPVSGEDVDNGLTANRLRATGRDYPTEIVDLYTELPENALGPNARRLLQQAIADYGENPYDLAFGLEQRLRNSPEFRYDNDVRGLCDNVSAAECFAQHRRGYCLHYASTMAVLLREAGIPARLAEGFLPNERDPETGVEVIPFSSAHAWVEVWFPGFGWYAFDPTGGGLPGQVEDPLVDGPAVTPAPSATATPRPSLNVDRERDDLPRNRDGQSDLPPGSGRTGGGEPAVLIVVTVLLVAAVGALGFAAWQRGPRGEVTAEGVWRGVARTAGRFGWGPRPQQTVYEYAGTLGEVLPRQRPDLETVARAKVEVAYGRQELGSDAHRALRDAQRRLRLGLLRLAMRRKDRRRPR